MKHKKTGKKSEYVLDFRGAISSITLLEMSNKFKEMKMNQTLELLVRDKETIDDIFKILPESSCTKNIINENTFDRIIIKKIEEDN